MLCFVDTFGRQMILKLGKIHYRHQEGNQEERLAEACEEYDTKC